MTCQSLHAASSFMYLGVTLDRMLSYRQHLQNTAAKVKTRDNLLSRLAESSWGANADTLRTSALALCYSAAEYCCPVWSRSPHINLVDKQLAQLHSCHGFQFSPTCHHPTYGERPHVTSCCKSLKITLMASAGPTRTSSTTLHLA